MSAYLLNAAYLLLLVALSPWLLYSALKKGKYREGFGEKLLGLAPKRREAGTCIWLHAVSVGEVNVLRTLVGELERRHPRWQLFISTTTKTGYDLARTRFAGVPVFYCPLDFTWSVRRALRRVRPDLVVLAELEVWPNLVREAGRMGARVAVVNGRLSDRSFRGYHRFRKLLRPVFASLDVVAAQNGEYARRFTALGVPQRRVHDTGSLKYDGAETDRANPLTVKLKHLAGIGEGDLVFLAGSTQDPEESLALDAFLELSPPFPALRLLLVPRHPERFGAVAAMLDRRGVTYSRRSTLVPDGSGAAPRVLLIDTVGELGAWWGTADIALVGGSFGSRGGQNMIEPAAYGAAVSFGPNTQNFRQVVAALLAAEGATVVHSGEELTAFVRRCLAEPDYRLTLGGNALAFVQSQLGAGARTADLIDELLSETGDARRMTRRAA